MRLRNLHGREVEVDARQADYLLRQGFEPVDDAPQADGERGTPCPRSPHRIALIGHAGEIAALTRAASHVCAGPPTWIAWCQIDVPGHPTEPPAGTAPAATRFIAPGGNDRDAARAIAERLEQWKIRIALVGPATPAPLITTLKRSRPDTRLATITAGPRTVLTAL